MIFLKSANERIITPTSSFLLSIFLSAEASSLKSSSPSLLTVPVACIIGATIRLVTNTDIIRHTASANILSFTVAVTIAVIPDIISVFPAFTTNTNSLFFPT